MNPAIQQLIAARPARRLTDAQGQPSQFVMTMPCRLHWPALAAPTKMQGSPGEPKYSATLIIPAGADLGPLRTILAEAATAKFGPNFRAMNLRNPLRSQAEKSKFDGMASDANAFYINATSQRAPYCYGPGGSADIVSPEALYAGCWVVARVNAYAYDKAGNKGVAFGLSSIQKVGDDAVLALGSSDPADGIEAVPAAVQAAGGVAPVSTAAMQGTPVQAASAPANAGGW